MKHATTHHLSALAGLVAGRMRALADDLADARAGDPGAIHRARVASRRVREALAIVRGIAAEDDVDRAVGDARRVTRALGPVREIDVTRSLLIGEADVHHWPPLVVAGVLRDIDAERQKRVRTMTVKLDRVRADEVRDRGQSMAVVVTTASPNVWRRVLAARVKQRGVALVRAIDAVGPLYMPDRLHATRIAAKKFRYLLELAHAAAGTPVARTVRDLKATQESLGRLHDLTMLQHAVDGGIGRAGRGRSATSAEVIVHDTEPECRAVHGSFLASAASLRELIEATARKVASRLSGRRMLRIAANRHSRAGRMSGAA